MDEYFRCWCSRLLHGDLMVIFRLKLGFFVRSSFSVLGSLCRFSGLLNKAVSFRLELGNCWICDLLHHAKDMENYLCMTCMSDWRVSNMHLLRNKIF